jgi:uncharacterized glyoxalase superfamily protein PhnB
MAKTATATTTQRAEVLGGIVPYLSVDGATKAAEFYDRAFGAKEVARHPVDQQGRTMHIHLHIMHIHLHINGASLMLGDVFPEHGHPYQAPQAFNLLLAVADVDVWWKRAVDAGAEVVLPLQVMFWGDRYGQLRDPFGVMWSFNAPVEAA